MKSNEVIKEVMAAEGVTQKALSTAMGLKSPQAIGNILYRDSSVRVSSFVKMLDIMGYEVVVRKKIGKSDELTVKE